ncbi:hypothetical protein [Psychromonas ossibalaenae]|uniref:hypothetical protein n=1 Tax=Psychromonas ossibalaenae TaxID=444922 RepID=UPI0003A11DE7|nr:hypothetical protein [Psychromonas ossibalaenae]
MHLCFSISAHGFGHGAISTSVIECLMQDFPEVQITVLSLLPRSYLDSRLSGPFTHIEAGNDFGMLMDSPIKIDVHNSRLKYQHLFDNWQQAVSEEVEILKCIKPDCVISNISPVTLDAAIQLNIPCASVAPFNWAQIYERYCLNAELPDTQAVYEKMLCVYKNVDYNYKPLPSVPLANTDEINIASINSIPQDQRQDLLQSLPLGTEKVALVALGGLPMSLDLKNWPVIPGWHWLVDQPENQLRADMTQVSDVNMSFLQLIGSCDLILTKPGYGTYCEIAAVALYKRVRVISLERSDWPETPFLNAFLVSRVPFSEVHIELLQGQHLAEVIEKLNVSDYPRSQLCEDGAQQLVKHLLSHLQV